MGEIEAAEQGKLPHVLQLSDLHGALHNHSTWSDGADTIEEMALAAKELGWEYIGLSDHSQSAFYAHGLKPDDVRRQHEEIDALNARLSGITILKGIESDILPDGRLDYDDEVLARYRIRSPPCWATLPDDCSCRAMASRWTCAPSSRPLPSRVAPWS
jgi:DNA polymerase (family 10)